MSSKAERVLALFQQKLSLLHLDDFVCSDTQPEEEQIADYLFDAVKEMAGKVSSYDHHDKELSSHKLESLPDIVNSSSAPTNTLEQESNELPQKPHQAVIEDLEYELESLREEEEFTLDQMERIIDENAQLTDSWVRLNEDQRTVSCDLRSIRQRANSVQAQLSILKMRSKEEAVVKQPSSQAESREAASGSAGSPSTAVAPASSAGTLNDPKPMPPSEAPRHIWGVGPPPHHYVPLIGKAPKTAQPTWKSNTDGNKWPDWQLPGACPIFYQLPQPALWPRKTSVSLAPVGSKPSPETEKHLPQHDQVPLDRSTDFLAAQQFPNLLPKGWGSAKTAKRLSVASTASTTSTLAPSAASSRGATPIPNFAGPSCVSSPSYSPNLMQFASCPPPPLIGRWRPLYSDGVGPLYPPRLGP